jgi:endoglucanase
MAKTCWSVNHDGYFEAPGASVLAFHSTYPEGKQGGVEIIHHGERVATCGDMRLERAPGQWGEVPAAGRRTADPDNCQVDVSLSYPKLGIDYAIRLRGEGDAIRLSLNLVKPFDRKAVSHGCLQMEFFPAAFFGKTYHLGGTSGVFPRQANGPLLREPGGSLKAAPLASGPRLVLAPEDPLLHMVIEQVSGEMELLDGRNTAANGWFVVRSPIPEGATSQAVEWVITPHRIPGWHRAPVICVSQVGYHPDQAKRAILELDAWERTGEAALFRIDPDRGSTEVTRAGPRRWGRFLRYEYGVFDFSPVRTPGVYVIKYGGRSSGPFRIGDDVYRSDVWQPTLEAFFPVQMCHVRVEDGYRVWHGVCHLDDAIQAPPGHVHFDGYEQGPSTEAGYQAHQHIPGLNVGGWHDAGDYDLAAGSQATTTFFLALAREAFGLDTDQTTVRKGDRLVLLHRPDGVPDIIEQIAWGAECLLGGYRACGHSFSGIIEGAMAQYVHLGDASTMTDNLAYDPTLKPGETRDVHSGTMDDRWAFTSRDTALEYHVATALSAAGRVLSAHDPDLAQECRQTAQRAWDYEQTHPPVEQRSAYVPRDREAREVFAAVELLIATGKACYRQRLTELLPFIIENIGRVGWTVVRALDHVDDEAFRHAIGESLRTYSSVLARKLAGNPFGVPFEPHVWGIGWQIQQFALGQYYLIRSFPELFDRETLLSVVNYVLGCHPGSDVSLVSGVGARSLTIAYGANRAEWSYIPGGMVSGPNLIRPDFPEMKDNFPFLWQQAEYVMPGAATYLFCILAADAILNAGRT